MRDARFVTVDEAHERLLVPVERLRFQRGSFGEARDYRPAPDAPRVVAEREENAAQPNTLVEVIVFGKIHYVTVEEFKRQAPRYAVMLWTERDLLGDQVRAVGQIEEEWRKGSLIGRLGGLFRDDATAAATLRALRAVLRGIADPREDPQSERLRETGIVLHQVRASLAALGMRAAEQREAAIASAQNVEQGLTLVKDTSFQALLMASSFVPALKNPATEFGYRIGIVMLEAGASATGAWIAGTSRLREVFAVLKARLPQVLVDTFMSVARAYLGPAAAAAQATALHIIQQVIEFCFDVVMMGIEGQLSASPPDKVLIALAEKRLLSVLGIFLGRFAGYKPDDPRLTHLARQVIENTALVMAQELRSLIERSQAEGRAMSEIVLSELPWLLARVLQGVLLGMLRHARVEPHANDANAVSTESASVRPTLQLIYRQARNRRMIFHGQSPAPTGLRPPGVPKAKPIGWKDFLGDWRRLNLHRVFLHGLLKSVEDGGTILEGRVGNPSALRHVTEPGVLFKPGWLKAKTLKRGAAAILGLVGWPPRPEGDGATDPAVKRAQKKWDAERAELQKHGALVRPDGVVFHPDMLVEWSRAQEDKREIRFLAEKLRAAAAAGHVELGSEAAQRFLAEQLGGEATRDAFMATLARARVGFTSDTDLVAVVDAVTGAMVPVGEKGRLGGGADFQQNRERLDSLNRAANAFDRPAQEQETPLGRAGKAMFAHGGAAEVVLESGMLEHLGLGETFAVARGKEGFVRWTVNAASGEITVPVELLPKLTGGGFEVVSQGRFAVLRTPKARLVAAQVLDAIRSLPPGHPGVRAAVDDLGLDHLDAATRGRFAEALHDLARKGDPDAATHIDDALTLSWMKRIREAHRAENQDLLKLHPRNPQGANPVALEVERRRVYPRSGRLTKLRLRDRPRPLSSQVDDAEVPRLGAISARGVEAGLVARGLTLLAPENADAFEGVVPAGAIPELARWLSAHRVVLGVDAARRSVVAATFGMGTAFEGILRLYELATRYGLDGGAPKAWWELYLPVLPTTTSRIAGRLDPPTFTPALPGPLSSLLSFAEPRPGRELHAFRALRALPSFPDGEGARRAFVGLGLEAVWVEARSGRIETEAVTLAGRPVAVFLAQPIDVPADGPRVTRPLAADLADLATVLGYQRALRSLGYLEKEPDGVLDDATRAAVGAFQMDWDTGLAVDCRVGPATREALREALRELEMSEVVQ